MMKKYFQSLLLLIIVIALVVAGGYIVSLINGGDLEGTTPVFQVTDDSNDTSNTGGTETPSPTDRANDGDNIQQEKTLTITAVGDILLGRGVGSRLKAAGRDYKYPFEKVVEYLQRGDIIFGNLEESITSSTHCLYNINEGGKWVLKNDVSAIDSIKYAGFNLMNIANNHILDYYETGLYDTINILDANNIAHAGAGSNLSEARKPAIIEKNGVKVGMLSYTDWADITYKGDPPLCFLATETSSGVSPMYESYIKEDIEKLRDQVDLLIVSLHWGYEESFYISPEQRQFAYRILGYGADMILGHHPHQFQGIEIYEGKPIIYSLGNFIFDQNDPENQESFIVEMKYVNNKLQSMYATPVRTMEKTQVVRPTGEDAAALLERQIRLCKELGTTCRIENDALVFEIEQQESSMQ